jgi:hypothetical protein
MDCKTFHRNLEDYLDGGLDFSGRFGMERHAQQCISCGKELSDAQRLSRMVSELQRVKAPANFEDSVLKEIGIRKAYGRFSGFRSLWIHGFEWPSYRKIALASSVLAILVFGIFYASHRANFDRSSASREVAAKPATIPVKVEEAKSNLDAGLEMPARKTPAVEEAPESARKDLRPAILKRGPVVDRNLQEVRDIQGVQDMDYVEYLVPGPDNQPVPVRLPLPKVIPMRYGQMSEEYFIQNVSH